MPTGSDLDLNLLVKVQDAQFRTFIAQFEKLNGAMAKTAAMGGGAAAANNKVANSTTRIARETDAATRSMGAFGQKTKFVKSVLEAFVLYRGFVLMQTQIVEMTRELIHFQHELGIVQTQLSGFGKDFRPEIRREVLSVAQETGMAMTTLAKAEFEVVSANIAVADSYRILGLAAKAAVAGNLDDVEVAFNSALSQANVFGETFEDVFDKQFDLVKRGIFTYEQLAGVIGTVAVAADRAGQDFSTANAALAAISQVLTGKQLERGATGLRNALEQIATSSDKIADEFGIAVTDAEGNFRNLLAIVKDLHEVTQGLSESDLEERIKRAFPDIRESLGITTLIKTLPQFEQFFVEQQFSQGSLEDAFDTASESLLKQAGILKADFLPAMDSAVGVLDGLVSGINDMNDALPGFTQALFGVAAAATAVQLASMVGGAVPAGAASRFMGAGMLMSPEFGPQVGPNAPRELRRASALRQFRFGRASMIGGGAIAGGMILGRQEGSTVGGSIMGGAGLGASVGMMGGAPGMAAGALVGGLAGAIAHSLKDDAEEVGESMAEAFARELKESGDMKEALTLAIAIGEDAGGELGIRSLSSGTFISKSRESKKARLERLGLDSVAGRVAGGLVLPTVDLEAKLFGRDSKFARQDLTSERDVDRLGAVRAARAARAEAEGLADEFRLSDADRANVISIAVDETLKAILPGDGSEEMRNFIEGLAESELTTDGVTQALAILGDESITDAEAFSRVAAMLADAELMLAEGISSLAEAFGERFGGGFDKVADVFDELGADGSRLASIFRNLASASSAVSTLESLRGATVDGLDPLQQAGFTFSIDDVISTVSRFAVSEASASFGLAPADVSKFDFAKALMGDGAEGGESFAAVGIGATGLADSLFVASDMVRAGLIDGLGFAADELEMMGEELQEFNRLMHKINILKELQALEEFSKQTLDPESGLFGTLASAQGEVKSFFEQLAGDENKLADLLTNIEFGDVNIDQSRDFNIVVRLGGDVADPTSAAATADAIVDGLKLRLAEESL